MSSALSASYLLAAKLYIQDHLDDLLLSCDRVAAAAGVSSQAHFARAFKARYGMTASKLRGR